MEKDFNEIRAPFIVGHDEIRKIDELVADPRNARVHSAEQIAQLEAAIREFGFTTRILIDNQDTIIAGHARLIAARKLGMMVVPVIVLSHLTPQQRRALAIADNQLALNATWDEEKLRAELEGLQEESFDLGLLGLEDEELARLLAAE